MDFPGGPEVRTLLPCKGHGFNLAWGTKIPHAEQHGHKKNLTKINKVKRINSTHTDNLSLHGLCTVHPDPSNTFSPCCH